MKPSSFVVVILLTCFSSFGSDPKPNILFQGLKSKSHIESLFIESLESYVRSALVTSRRANIIIRDSTYWQNLRRELELKDFIDGKTALRLGELSGASHYLDGIFIRLVTESKTEHLPGGTTKLMYNTIAELSLSLIDLQSGKYESSFTLQQSAWSNEAEQSRTMCFSQLANDVRAKISRLFSLRALVTDVKTESHEIGINQGETDGVIPQSIYLLSSDKTVGLKITQVGQVSSRAKLISGDMTKLKVGSELYESFDNSINTVHVIRVKDGKTYLDGGSDLAIKKGDLFVLRNQELISSYPSPVYEESFPAAVVVTEVKNDFAIARIAKGFSAIKNGTELISSEDQSLLKRRFFSAGYKYGLTTSIKANGNNGTVTVTNNIGEFQIPTDYNEDTKSLSKISIITLGFGTHNLAKRLSTTLYADIYDIGNGALKNWIAHLDVAHEQMVVENIIYFFYGGGIGYGRLKQKVPGNVIETISRGNSTDVRSSSLFATAKAGSRLMIRHVALSISCSYDFLQYKSWEYTAENSESTKAPAALLPYPSVKLSGLYVNGSLSYFF